MIQPVHPDHAAIRRYLVDGGFLARADGICWRTGGRYDHLNYGITREHWANR